MNDNQSFMDRLTEARERGRQNDMRRAEHQAKLATERAARTVLAEGTRPKRNWDEIVQMVSLTIELIAIAVICAVIVVVGVLYADMARPDEQMPAIRAAIGRISLPVLLALVIGHSLPTVVRYARALVYKIRADRKLHNVLHGGDD